MVKMPGNGSIEALGIDTLVTFVGTILIIIAVLAISRRQSGKYVQTMRHLDRLARRFQASDGSCQYRNSHFKLTAYFGVRIYNQFPGNLRIERNARDTNHPWDGLLIQERKAGSFWKRRPFHSKNLAEELFSQKTRIQALQKFFLEFPEVTAIRTENGICCFEFEKDSTEGLDGAFDFASALTEARLRFLLDLMEEAFGRS